MTAALQPQPNQISAASQQKSETSLLQNNSHSSNSITIGNPTKYLSQEQQQNPRIGMSSQTSSPQTATSPWSLSPSTFLPHHHTQDTHTSHRTSRVTHNWRMMVVLFIVFLSYNTPPVYSLPLSGDFQELTSISHQPELKESKEGVAHVRDMGRGRDVGEMESQRDGNYVVQPQSQLYLHSPEIREKNEMRFEDQQMSRENVGTPQHQQQQQHLQRLQNNPMDEEGSSADWETVIDPRLYLLTEWNSNPFQQQRMRRNSGPSLSIVNPLDVLRQRLLLEIARRKMRQSHNQIMANAEILKNIGRRRKR